MNATARQTGLMLATMEPAASFEEEFQQWYDTEHFPERRDTPGFLTATRMVCLSGWPRYIALYDLESLEVLDGPDYAKIAGRNYTRWTHRIVGKVWGQYRAGARQIYPGGALLGQAGSFSRLALWRFCQVPEGMAETVTDGLRAIYEGQPETAQIRVFEAHQHDGTDVIALIELHAPWEPPPGAVAALKEARRHLDCVNVYTPYERRRESSFPRPA
ncbi:DUF4286 family protein [Ancylobacter mangrovi]|uniref:DUF4286 family protein n=1 Tax=Ancylobacter mangrovi TaxID=2972472 RepID=UPI002163C52F|nr:DUF4286 family protein [Ancylobacter mangrovi]MCS0500823.1 hypothetical protein [Ancylobacter mangrovi]